MNETMEGFVEIKFKDDYSCTLIIAYDEKNDCPIEEDETFPAGSIEEVNILEDYGEYISVQFGDGSCLYGLKKEHFDIVNS
jgi:hypothetical protein